LAAYDDSMAGEHSGTVALFGGSPFVGNDDIDRSLLQGQIGPVGVLPTADAFEQPQLLITSAEQWGERLGIEVVPIMALTRGQSSDPSFVSLVDSLKMVWLVGDSPIHLRTALKDTPLWASIHAVLDRGGLVAAVGASAAAMCDPMTDPRGGAFTFGLGLVEGFAVLTESETWATEQLQRAQHLSVEAPLVELPTGSAIVLDRSRGVWQRYGDVTVHGDW
jgi:cyanophycinase